MTDAAATKNAVATQYDTAGHTWHSIRGSGHELLEKPAMYALLPNVEGKRVLCVGCGFGEECAHLHSLGASHVFGIDLSAANIEQAVKTFPYLEFRVMDMEDLSLPPASFDIVFSSLALHYIESWSRALSGIYSVLSPNGTFICSTHHPASWSALKNEDDRTKRQLLGFEVNKISGEVTTYGDYLHERPIMGKFAGKFEARFYHKSFSSMLREFREARFRVVDCQEPVPLPIAKELDPQFWELRSKFPLFILFRLEKEPIQS